MTTLLEPCARCYFFGLICLVTSEVTATIEVVTSTCETQQTVKGEEATISCHFDKDIGKIQRDFRVNFYPVSGPSDQNPATVFMCAWDNGISKTTLEPDYLLVGNISKTITLRIQRVNEAHIGSYACVIEPSNREDAKPCTLFLNDTKTYCEDRTVLEGEETNITCHFADDLNKIHKDLRVDFAPNRTRTLYTNTVVTVQWHDEQPVIHSEPGHMVLNISNSLIIIITNVTVANSGEYRCHLSPSNDGDAKVCNLKVSPPSNGNLTPDISINDDNKWKIIVGAIVGTVIVVGLLVMVVIGICRWIHKRSVNEATRTTEPTNAPRRTEYIQMQHLPNEATSVLNERDHLLKDETGMGERYSVQETSHDTELQKSSKLVTSLNRPSPTSNRRTGDMQD